MFHLKHDVKIQIKNEKEVFRFVRLLIFTFIFSAVFLGVPDYIWNLTWYRASLCLVPWIVAIPAVINCISRKTDLKELFGTRIIFQILTGIGIGTIIAILWIGAEYILQDGNIAQMYPDSIWIILLQLCIYVFAVGPSEELVYRVAIMGNLEVLLQRYKWTAPIIANTLFALSHLFQHDWGNVALAFVIGGIYTFLYYKWKKCGYIMVSIIHGMFDFMIAFLPYIWNKL